MLITNCTGIFFIYLDALADKCIVLSFFRFHYNDKNILFILLMVALSEFRTSKCCRGCGHVLRHPNGDDRTSYCETKKGRTPHGISAKDIAIGIWMQLGRLVRGFWL